MANSWSETLYDAYAQQFTVDKIYFESKTDHQHLMIFHNALFGRVMVLDGIVQTTEKDEFIYHEMLTHLPILAHGNVKRVLIIGGGDGGMIREVCKHQSVRHITQVEIDQAVIDMAKQYLPNHSQGAYDDARVNIVINDGMAFVKETNERFDVIISDSTDPIGPGESLFSQNFYACCQSCLNPGGVLVTQNGVAYMQQDEVSATATKLAPLFQDWHFFTAAVPTYVGGAMTFSWATDDQALRQQSVDLIQARYQVANIETRYYTPEVHVAAFALPKYVLQVIDQTGRKV
ncbi:MAG: polyamine aminopropyltransferase [Methylococcales bacterium]|jgi:spermidine synthase|nr:polyamine aminopropyltransferase [Methylococcales bacterium]MBT7408648.1 polyamine aminopropyltransferase [Methylococcales bacterium]